MINIMDHLTLREQVKLLELAAEAGNYEVRQHALDILNQYRRPPVFNAPPMTDSEMVEAGLKSEPHGDVE